MSGIPLYVQVREKLRSELSQMKPGDPIPVEAGLEEKFGVSRITVRRAVEDLVAEGLLVRQQGRGTFVQRPKLTHELSMITSWTEQLRTLGFTPKTAHREMRLTSAPLDVAETLRLKPNDQVIQVRRVRLANREPISYMVNYIPSHLVPGFIERKFAEESLYELLTREYGLSPSKAVDTVGTRLASEEEAKALHVARKVPVLCVRRASYLEDDTPMELAIVVSRGDRYQYQVTLHNNVRSKSPVPGR